MCKKQTSVSHSSTEVEIVSLDASLRMDGHESTELLLIGCLTELIWTPKSKTKYIDTKHQLADIFDQREFHT